MPVLVISADARLIAAIERCAAASGTPLEITDAGGAMSRWDRALLVLVGADLLEGLPALARRPGVIVVGAGIGVRAEPDPSVWRWALELGAEHVISLPDADGWLVDRLGSAVDMQEAPGLVVAVMGSCGGAGASMLALAMGASAAARGRGALVIDADAHGGGIEILAGTDGQPGARWADVRGVHGRIAPATLRDAFPVANGASILSVPRQRDEEIGPSDVMTLAEAARRAFGLVVIDLPRALVRELEADAWVIVTPGRVRPVLAAAQLLRVRPQAHVALRQVKGGGVDAADAQVAMGSPVAVTFASERVIAEAGEHGDPLPTKGALAVAAAALVDRVLR